MGIRFKKTIKIGNLLKINLSKSGVSATIGKQGASINLGSKGTYLNLSPTIAGIKGTGLSYRQKITNGYGGLLGSLVGKIKGKKDEEEVIEEKPVQQIENKTEEKVDESIIEKYSEDLLANIAIHKFTDDVLSKQEIINKVEELESDASKQVYKLAIDGDEDTIESLVGAFLNGLQLNYPVNASYELEDNVLYVDLDLPSGIHWVKYNLGAHSESDYGLYYQFGATEGFTDSSHSTWDTCPFNNGSETYNEHYFQEVISDGVDASNNLQNAVTDVVDTALANKDSVIAMEHQMSAFKY